jgi:thiopurine S-methyltransferase
MEAQFWNERWQMGDIGFHQADVHDLLGTHWPSLGLAQDSAVFVPLCGKSLDMVWLAAWGHKVIGVELSELAVDAFFAERELVPATEKVHGFTVKRSGPYEIWCGDIFDLPREAIATAAAVYDRASLVAFPPAMQPRYARKLAELTPAPILLVSLAFDQAEMAGPPFSTGLQPIAYLFAADYQIKLLESRDGLERSQNLRKRGLTRLVESVYLLQLKTK